MNICIVIPNKSYHDQAGARIRYLRIQSHLEELGHNFSLVPMQSVIDEVGATYDVYIFSKVYESASLVLAASLHESGKLIACDLFDDYFSQMDDPRLTRLRHWLKEFSKIADFFLCSTKGMRSVVKEYAPEKDCHVLNDPVDQLDEDLAQTLERRLGECCQTQKLRLAWFGMGDNPYFKVGLDDLIGVMDEVEILTREYDVELNILTNSRALTSATLSRLSQSPVKFSTALWSEEDERTLLRECFACIIPVNDQSFSRVKSPNRAITALAHGCQVISPGFPLYDLLGEFIYRTTDDFVESLRNRKPRLDVAKIPDLDGLLGSVASATTEAQRLSEFVTAVSRTESEASHLLLLHGLESSGATHKLVRKQGGYSVASPFCRLTLNFDLRIINSNKKLQLMATRTVVEQEQLPVGSNWTVFADSEYCTVMEVEFDRPLPGSFLKLSYPETMLYYRPVMDAVQFFLEKLFPQGRIIVAEDSRKPWMFEL